MAKVPFFNDDIEFVSKLTNKPTADMGMPPATLKAEFDKAGKTIQRFLNETLIPAVNAIVAVTGVTDKTLTNEDAPADAKAVGDRISGIETAVEERFSSSGYVGTSNLADGAVTSGKIAEGAVTADAIASGAVTEVYPATIGTGWTGSEAPYTITVNIPGVLAKDKPDVDLVPSSDFSDAQAQVEAWGYVYRAETGVGNMVFYALEKPDVALPIQVRCIRK